MLLQAMICKHFYCSHIIRSLLKMKKYIYTKVYIFSYKLFTKFGHFFVLFSANGHKSIVIFCMPMMTIINLYYNDKENRPCLYLPNYAWPDSISCAAHGSTAKGGWEFYCPVGKEGKVKANWSLFPVMHQIWIKKIVILG